jgi:hypothetical protein
MDTNVLFAAAVAWLGLVVFAEEGGETLHQTVARVRSFLYGVLLAIVGLSGKPDDESDDEGTEPDTARDT